MLKRLVICGGITVVLTACGNANWTSVYRTYQPASDNSNRGTSALIDAKQRTIIAANRDSGVIICAEPSPDAFSAVSSSFSGSASFSGETSPEAALALSLALNEAAGQLRRARTVQLLRDSLFRACEAYLNGAMDSIDYARIANKYADATVTLLAIEQLTSPDTGPSTVIAPGKTQAQSEASVPGQPGENQPTPTDGNQPPSPGPGQPASPAPNPNPDAGAGGNASESSNPDEPVPPAGGNASASTEPPSPPPGGRLSRRSGNGRRFRRGRQRGGRLSRQFLRNNAQNSCIDFFSQGAYIPDDSTDAEVEQSKERLMAIRTYCDIVFHATETQTEILKETRIGQTSPLSRQSAPTTLLEKNPEN